METFCCQPDFSNKPHLTLPASNTDHRTMREVFHTGQMQFYHFTQSLSFCYCCFLKSHVFGDVWKLSFAIIKGATNSLLPEKTKWPQTRIKTMLKCNISLRQSVFILPHTKFHGFTEKCH